MYYTVANKGNILLGICCDLPNSGDLTSFAPAYYLNTRTNISVVTEDDAVFV